jgi:hypothetical protein
LNERIDAVFSIEASGKISDCIWQEKNKRCCIDASHLIFGFGGGIVKRGVWKERERE